MTKNVAFHLKELDIQYAFSTKFLKFLRIYSYFLNSV